MTSSGQITLIAADSRDIIHRIIYDTMELRPSVACDHATGYVLHRDQDVETRTLLIVKYPARQPHPVLSKASTSRWIYLFRIGAFSRIHIPWPFPSFELAM
jgi:hypothetical protein